MRVSGRSAPVVPVVPAVFVLPDPISVSAGRSVRRSLGAAAVRPACGMPGPGRPAACPGTPCRLISAKAVPHHGHPAAREMGLSPQGSDAEAQTPGVPWPSANRMRGPGSARPTHGPPCRVVRLRRLAHPAASPARRQFPTTATPRHGQCAASAAAVITRCRKRKRSGWPARGRPEAWPWLRFGPDSDCVAVGARPLHLVHAAASAGTFPPADAPEDGSSPPYRPAPSLACGCRLAVLAVKATAPGRAGRCSVSLWPKPVSAWPSCNLERPRRRMSKFVSK
jgi:hypothetical protein